MEFPTVADTLERMNAVIGAQTASQHKRMAEVFRDHWWGEVIGDLDRTMATMVEEPSHHGYGALGTFELAGAVVVRDVYQDMIDRGLIAGSPLRNDRWSFGSWGCQFDAELWMLFTGEEIPDAPEPLERERLFVVTRQMSVVVPFDTERMLMRGETFYIGAPTIVCPAEPSTRRELLGRAAAEVLYEP